MKQVLLNKPDIDEWDRKTSAVAGILERADAFKVEGGWKVVIEVATPWGFIFDGTTAPLPKKPTWKTGSQVLVGFYTRPNKSRRITSIYTIAQRDIAL